jgi:uncharacterized membrane protein
MITFNIIHIAAVLLTGLAAGLFYGYDCSVIKGLGNLPDKEYLSAFQSINKAILNPYFFISFMGSLIVLVIATWLSYKQAPPMVFYLLLAATILYAAGVFGVTMFGNVPLNNSVEQFDIANASADAIRAMRLRFENSWNMLHHIRTYAAILAFLLAIVSLVKKA